LLNGIFNNSSFDVNKVFKSIKRSDYDYAIKSKDRIIESGKNLFGKLSYDEVNIHNIMENIGLASGTFYKYFTNKESFFELLVEISGKHIRHFISENLSDDLNRLEREIRGIFLFINYLNFDRNCYNIVREAEFVNRKKAIEYYASFVQGYKKRGLEGLNNEKLRQIPNYNDTVIEFLLGISHYFGIEYIYSNENLTIDKILVDLAYLLKNGIGGLQK